MVNPGNEKKMHKILTVMKFCWGLELTCTVAEIHKMRYLDYSRGDSLHLIWFTDVYGNSKL